MTKFSELNLNPKVLKAVEEAGYETPTPIQEGAIPAALEGRDVLGIAQTGTGKTASFTLPMITMLARGRARARMPRSLVLCPTRELAAQVAENFEVYAKNVKLTKALLIGGVSFKEQDMLIDKGVDVLIATPGRLLDHFERGKLLLTGVQIMVVDEADRMLDMGFIPDIERIFSLTPFTRQTLFFSATMAPEIERITNTFLSAPARIEVARQASASETIEQAVVKFKASRREREGSEKRAVLRALIESEGEKCTNAIIFCNRKTDVDICATSLKKYGYDAAPIHGDLEQSQRTRTLDGFREGKIRFLVASDVAARGLDVPSVSHVFNFDVPSHAEDYVHRIGRTGRAGREGKAMMICIPRDEKNFEAIQKLLQKDIPQIESPVLADTASEQDPRRDEKKPARSRSRRYERRTAPQADEDVTTKADTAPENTATPDASSATQPDATAQPDTVVHGPANENTARPDTTASDTTARDTRDTSKARAPRLPQRERTPRNDGRNDPKVVGLGEHMPSFIALSFKER